MNVALWVTQTATVFTDITIHHRGPCCGFYEGAFLMRHLGGDNPERLFPAPTQAPFTVLVTHQQVTRKERGGSAHVSEPPSSCRNTPTARDSHTFLCALVLILSTAQQALPFVYTWNGARPFVDNASGWSPEVSGTGEFVGRLSSLSGGLAGSRIFIRSSLQPFLVSSCSFTRTKKESRHSSCLDVKVVS